MRISDWSSDVCSSDLILGDVVFGKARNFARTRKLTYWFDAFLGTLAISKSQNSAIPAQEQMQKVGLLIRVPRRPLTSSCISPPPLSQTRTQRVTLRSEKRRVGKEYGRKYSLWRC